MYIIRIKTRQDEANCDGQDSREGAQTQNEVYERAKEREETMTRAICIIHPCDQSKIQALKRETRYHTYDRCDELVSLCCSKGSTRI
jgi:hypothetical protein